MPIRLPQLTRVVIYLLVLSIGYFLVTTLFTATDLSSLGKAIAGPNAEERKIKVFKVQSAYQNGTTEIRVLLPDNFDRRKHYKVLYILSVVPHKLDYWWNSGLMQAVKYNVHNKYDLICVYATIEKMPWYADHATDRHIRQESFMLQFVVPFIDSNYPTVRDPGGRLLIGYSKSGCGAFTLLLRHPDIFGRAAAWDAPLLYEDIYQERSAGTAEVFGAKENFLRYYLPDLFKEKLALLKGKPVRLVLLGYGVCRTHVEKTHRLLESLTIPHVYQNSARRKHQWQSGWFQEAVAYLIEPGVVSAGKRR